MKKEHQTEKIDQNKRAFVKKAWKSPIVAPMGVSLLMSATTSKLFASDDCGAGGSGSCNDKENSIFRDLSPFSKR